MIQFPFNPPGLNSATYYYISDFSHAYTTVIMVAQILESYKFYHAEIGLTITVGRAADWCVVVLIGFCWFSCPFTTDAFGRKGRGLGTNWRYKEGEVKHVHTCRAGGLCSTDIVTHASIIPNYHTVIIIMYVSQTIPLYPSLSLVSGWTDL